MTPRRSAEFEGGADPPAAVYFEAERHRAEKIARRAEHVSLAAHPDFEAIFVDCMNFPRSLPGSPA